MGLLVGLVGRSSFSPPLSSACFRTHSLRRTAPILYINLSRSVCFEAGKLYYNLEWLHVRGNNKLCQQGHFYFDWPRDITNTNNTSVAAYMGKQQVVSARVFLFRLATPYITNTNSALSETLPSVKNKFLPRTLRESSRHVPLRTHQISNPEYYSLVR